MTAASASSTSDKTRSKATRDPSIAPPAKFERIPKEPGSKKLVMGEWIEVEPGDEDEVSAAQLKLNL